MAASKGMKEMVKHLTGKDGVSGSDSHAIIQVTEDISRKGLSVQNSMTFEYGEDVTMFNSKETTRDVNIAARNHVRDIIDDVIMAHDIWDENTKEITKTSRQKVKVASDNLKFRRKRGGGAISSMGLVRIMNIILEQKMKYLMEKSTKNLNYVSGRLANSAQVVGLDVGKTSSKGQVNVSLMFNYMTMPYKVFEPGQGQGSTARDPKKLIREAMDLALLDTLAPKSYKRFKFNKRFSSTL